VPHIELCGREIGRDFRLKVANGDLWLTRLFANENRRERKQVSAHIHLADIDLQIVAVFVMTTRRTMSVTTRRRRIAIVRDAIVMSMFARGMLARHMVVRVRARRLMPTSLVHATPQQGVSRKDQAGQ
jgi:hypothetical protein